MNVAMATSYGWLAMSQPVAEPAGVPASAGAAGGLQQPVPLGVCPQPVTDLGAQGAHRFWIGKHGLVPSLWFPMW
jgi:hypothetical protein